MRIKHRHFLTTHGQITSIIAADYNNRAINTSDGAWFVDVDASYNPAEYYYSFDLKRFELKPNKPSQHHVFDYEQKQWYDPRSIEQLRDAKWKEIKQQRDLLRYAPIEFEGHFYQADPISASILMGAALAKLPRVFTTADNQDIALSPEQLMQIYILLQQRLDDVQDLGRAARTAIYAAENIDDLNEVQL